MQGPILGSSNSGQRRQEMSQGIKDFGGPVAIKEEGDGRGREVP